MWPACEEPKHRVTIAAMATPLRHTAADIAVVRDHVAYEFSMLIRCADLVDRLGTIMPAGEDQTTISNTMVEAFASHFRGLTDFFWPIRATNDDVLASELAPSWQCPPAPAYFKALRGRTNEEVAHLTWTRVGVTVQGKTWPLGKIAEDMRVIFDSYAEAEAVERGATPGATPLPSSLLPSFNPAALVATTMIAPPTSPPTSPATGSS
jgi:hypothetical protein